MAMTVLYEGLDGEIYSAPVMLKPFWDFTDDPADNWGTGLDLVRVWQTAVDPPAVPLVLLEIGSRWDNGKGKIVGSRFFEASARDIEHAGRLAGYGPDQNPLAAYVPKRAVSG